MKTRIILTTLMFILITSLTAGATGIKVKDTLFASYLENAAKRRVTLDNLMANGFYRSSMEHNHLIRSLDNTFTIEFWVAGENWQTGNEMVNVNADEGESMLENWVTGRENWEQTGNEMVSVNALNGESMLEQWVSSRDCWEQK